MKNKELTFEEKISRIEDIVEMLEDAAVPLNDLILLYEEGMKLSIECRTFLEKAEMKVETITSEFSKKAADNIVE